MVELMRGGQIAATAEVVLPPILPRYHGDLRQEELPMQQCPHSHPRPRDLPDVGAAWRATGSGCITKLPILHRPNPNPDTCPGLLLLAMICLRSTFRDDALEIADLKNLCRGSPITPLSAV